MTDNVIFQSATPATPPTSTTIATDYKPVGGGGSAHFQRVVIDIGPDGTSVPLAWGGTGLPLGTLPGTVQMLGTLQPLAGSVHPAAALPGTSQISGTVQALTGAISGTTFTVSSAGTTVVLAGAVGTRWRVTSEFLSANGSVNATWLSMGGSGTTGISGTFFSAVAGNGLVRPAAPPGRWYYQTQVGSALGFFLSLGTATSVDITYEVG